MNEMGGVMRARLVAEGDSAEAADDAHRHHAALLLHLPTHNRPILRPHTPGPACAPRPASPECLGLIRSRGSTRALAAPSHQRPPVHPGRLLPPTQPACVSPSAAPSRNRRLPVPLAVPTPAPAHRQSIPSPYVACHRESTPPPRGVRGPARRCRAGNAC
jgi:hypothetical protein